MIATSTEARLRAHVAMLAGQIGERHVFRPHALAAAADYIAETWRAQGYRPERELVAAGGTTSANIVDNLPGPKLAQRNPADRRALRHGARQSRC